MRHPVETTPKTKEELVPQRATGADIEKSAVERLRSAGVMAGDAVRCRYHDGMLILTGVVSSYYRKQLAQEIAGQVGGVDLVVNRVSVGSGGAKSP